jgi:hypothetical protein
MSENVEASTSRNPKGHNGLYRDNFTYISVLYNVKYIGTVLENCRFSGQG